jgi:hypothetical protein
MPTTTPDSISYPDASTTGGFIAAIAAMATSIQAAFSKRGRHNYQWADATARGAQAGMITGDEGYQVDVGITYRYNGSAWKSWESDWITYTPTLTTSGGTLGSASGTGRYKYVAGAILLKLTATVTTVGTASGSVLATLPVTAATSGGAISGKETVTSGKALTGEISGSATTVRIVDYSNTTMIAAGANAVLTGMYEPA